MLTFSAVPLARDSDEVSHNGSGAPSVDLDQDLEPVMSIPCAKIAP